VGFINDQIAPLQQQCKADQYDSVGWIDPTTQWKYRVVSTWNLRKVDFSMMANSYVVINTSNLPGRMISSFITNWFPVSKWFRKPIGSPTTASSLLG
jgi:hypothetical protein